MINPQDIIAIGVILRPVGLKGFCAVKSYGETLGNLEIPCKLFVGYKESVIKQIDLIDIELRPQGFVCKFAEYQERELVESLKGQTLFLEKSSLAVPGQDEFYHFELEGMTVITKESGKILGTVFEVHNFPTTDALEVLRPEGFKTMVPFRNEVVDSVDRENKKIFVYERFIEDLL
jgi:16S rRNA processing protein RimM